MYSLVRSLPPKAIAFRQVPIFAVSLTTAELFYKFHSFSLECLAFLATWFALDALLTAALPKNASPL